jgi:uncharacterized protein
MPEVAAFRAALAVVGIAIIDDAFIHPEPGARAGDHLASGLVPLAVLALLIAVAPRLPDLLRGWLAIFMGALAITAGAADGIRPVVVDRLSGDDVTALLGGLAGVVLVLLAIIATHQARAPVTAVSLGRPFETVRLTTSDGLKLGAWYVPSRNGAAVIAFPGRSQPVPHARMLTRHGYGVLLLDRRGEGASEGDSNAFGWAGEKDLRAAIGFLQRRRDVNPSRIGGLGLSVGGELLLQTAAHTPALRAVVSEGAGQRSLAEHLDNPEVGSVRRWFTGMLAQTAAVAVLSNSAPPDGLADLVPRIAPRRVLLIEALHGHADEVLNDVYHRAGGDSSELWKVARGGHTGALAAVPAAYERRVVGFFDRALPAR